MSSYTTDTNGNPARLSTQSFNRTETLPYALGEGMVRDMAGKLADSIIVAARTDHGPPVVWLTGNNYMPPLRSFPPAERVYQADNNRDGELFAWFAELVEARVAEANVMMECPEYDNALYAVDLSRWQHKETGDFYETWDINDEWEPKAQ